MSRLDGLGRLTVPLYTTEMVFVGGGFTGAELRDVFDATIVGGRFVGVMYGLSRVPDRPEYITPTLTLRGWKFDLVEPSGTLCAFPPYPGQDEQPLPDKTYPELQFLGVYTHGQPSTEDGNTVYGIMKNSLHGAVQSLTSDGRPGTPIWRYAVCDALMDGLMRLRN